MFDDLMLAHIATMNAAKTTAFYRAFRALESQCCGTCRECELTLDERLAVSDCPN